jgi:membrane protease YdiL (CAAX protease family)
LTEPGPETPARPEAPAEPADPGLPGSPLSPGSVSAGAAAPALGLFRFTIEGRRAPGLFVAGWLSTVVGAMGVLVGFLAGVTIAGILLYVAGLGVLLAGLVLLGGSQSLERRAAGLSYAGPSPILVLAAIGAGVYFAGAIVGTPLAILGVLDQPSDRPYVDLIGVVLQALVVLGIVRVLVVGTDAMTWTDMGLRARFPAALRDIAWGAAFALPAVFVTAIVANFLVTIVGAAPESPLPPAGTSVGLATNLLAGALIVPFYEELLFRGFATSAWARVVGPATAITRTSVLFALAHVLSQGGESFGQALGMAVVAAAARLPIAFVLGWVFIRRRSLWASVGLHVTFNAILLVVAEAAFESLPTA